MPKQGFGQTSGLFTNTGTGNNSIGVILPASDNEQIINSIMASYVPVDPSSGAYFEFGRLLIVSGSFSNGRTVISPVSNAVPADLPTIIFDLTLADKTTTIDFGTRGFPLSPGSQYTVVLTAPQTRGDIFPAFTDQYGFLNVQGFDIGKAQPFNEVR